MIDPSLFEVFFEEMHFAISGNRGMLPFPWHVRLFRRMANGDFPAAICTPTATGKTSVILCWLFALACESGKAAGKRKIPMRTYYVVDRRGVVDDVSVFSFAIVRCLDESTNPVITETAKALLSFGGGKALVCSLLRGAAPIDDNWVKSPVQPAIIVSTVDQTGSRLLFRGYSVSDRARPIHAGMVGNDAMILLDEAHCSDAFRHTLEAVKELRKMAVESPSLPFVFLPMTATPVSERDVLSLSAEDMVHPVLSKRLNAKKMATLIETKDKKIGLGLARIAVDNTKPGEACLVSVGRVPEARRAMESVRKLANDGDEVIMLTGRSRPHDRSNLMSNPAVRKMIDAGRDRAALKGRRFFMIATQCVEVGSNYDFDLLVTDLCSLSALRQRIGRLDRLGELGMSRIFILAFVGFLTEEYYDPVYGKSMAATWRWLKDMEAKHGCVDLGIRGFESMMPADALEREKLLAPMLVVQPAPPFLFPTHCDLMVQTCPEPSVVLDPSPYLHGPKCGNNDVSVVWRSDMGEDPSKWVDVVALCPPVSSEALPLAISSAKKFFSGRKSDDYDYDMEGIVLLEDKNSGEEWKPVLAWRGKESAVIMSEGDVEPGDVLVVPCSYGGCDKFGWNPACKSPVIDIAEESRSESKRKPVLRAVAGVIGKFGKSASMLHDKPSDAESMRTLLGLLKKAASKHTGQKWLVDMANDLCERGGYVVDHPSCKGYVIVGKMKPNMVINDKGHEVLLENHSEAVGMVARRNASKMFSDPRIVETIGIAGYGHDWGKWDIGFQTLMRGGNRLAALSMPPIAKSCWDFRTAAQAADIRNASGYPTDARHEILSMELAKSVDWGDKIDFELLLHLMTSSHGMCRPTPPVLDGYESAQVNVDFRGKAMSASHPSYAVAADGMSSRFCSLTRRYGWWGLAALEMVVRLADHEVSREEEE